MSPIISYEIYSNFISLNCLEFFCLFIHLCYHSGLFPHNYESRLLIIALAEFNVLFNPFDECLYFFNYFFLLISNIYIFFFNLFLPDYMCVCNFLLLLHFVYPYSILFYPLAGFMLSFIALIIWNILALLFSFSPIISKLWLLFARTDALFMTLCSFTCIVIYF